MFVSTARVWWKLFNWIGIEMLAYFGNREIQWTRVFLKDLDVLQLEQTSKMLIVKKRT